MSRSYRWNHVGSTVSEERTLATRLTPSSPSRIGNFEKQCVIRSLSNAVSLLLELLKRGYAEYITVACLLFSKKRTFYKDTRGNSNVGSYWSKGNGCPEVRTQFVTQFYDSHGFDDMLQLLRKNDVQYHISAEDAKVVLQVCSDYASLLCKDLVAALSMEILTYFSTLSSSELKKESTEAVGSLIIHARRLAELAICSPRETYELWLQITGNYIRSSSLPLRLFGFEQIIGLVQVARQARAFPLKYIVSGSGTECVNGEYSHCADSGSNGLGGNSAKYVKIGDGPDGQVLTLFRCTMRSGSKWWFISEADKDQPGTDKDIDYYQQQSPQVDDGTPPVANWTCIGKGATPPPLLTPSKEVVKGSDDNLELRLIQWVEKCQILKDIFGDRIHRELVSRSLPLIRFLAQASAMKTEYVDDLWRSGMGKEITLTEEIHTVAVSIVPLLEDDLLVYLLKKACATAENDENREIALAFAEKLAAENTQVLVSRSSVVVEGLLRFLWAIRRHPNLTIDPESDLVQFFTDALQHGEALRTVFLDDCIDTIRKSCDNPSIPISKALEMLKCLINTSSSNRAHVVEGLNEKHDLVTLLFQELAAYMKRSGKNRDGIDQRLHLVRYLFGRSPKLQLSVAQVNELWTICNDPMARESYFVFLNMAGTRTENLDPAFNLDVCFHVFEELICKHTQFLGELGYKCFHTYFIGLNDNEKLLEKALNGSIQRVTTLKLLGIDALWEIALDGTPIVATSAATELLQVYESLENSTVVACDDFLSRIFQRLKELDPPVNSTVQHCMNLVTGFVGHSTLPLSSSAHGYCGQSITSQITVQPQRIPPAPAASEKCESFQFEVNGKETLLSFRYRLEKRLNHPAEQTKLLESGVALTGEYQTLDQLDVAKQGGVELRALLFSHVVHNLPAPVLDGSCSALGDHPGDRLASNSSYFEILFKLLDKLRDIDTRRIVLNVLAALPTNQKLHESVKTLHPVFEENQAFVSKESYHKSVYVMEIIDELILSRDMDFIKAFVDSGACQQILDFFLNDSTAYTSGNAVALRIIKYCFFESGLLQHQRLDTKPITKKVVELVLSEHRVPSSLSSCVILECLQVLEAMDSSTLPMPSLKELILPLLIKNESTQVRHQWRLLLDTVVASSSEVCTVVFDILIDAIPTLTGDCEDYFALLSHLVQLEQLQPHFERLTKQCIVSFQRDFPQRISRANGIETNTVHQVLIGCLRVLSKVIALYPIQNAQEVLDVVYDDCLFAMPIKGKKRWPLCATAETRKPAMLVLSSLVRCKSDILGALIDKTRSFLSKSSGALHDRWGFECAAESRGRGEHVGLKNQGCSCYMNSFLQQIFMERSLRHGLLTAQVPAKEPTETIDLATVRTHPESLVGLRIANQCYNGKTFEAAVVDYDERTGQHTIQYDEGEDAVLNVFHGRPGKETGQFTILERELEGEEATCEVLRQVQRTFCYLRDSEMRYFDPKALVDACKCLNLEFSVYQQNDASEFCDKLLDRLESGLKKTPQGTACLQQTLGGKVISQKLPKGCGHVYEREEAFLRIELQIRGKDNIQDSLATFVEGELMDGDNKVECELCNTKKAAIRRTCFGTLPNLLMLHLKRFDLDYTTFETVKLNNRCSFPLELNMKPYTKAGLASDDEDAMVDDDDDDEYMYELKGVLVHSGVAQGGHYYSFIVDRESNTWAKFDDEDVTPFDPANIEAECFGGTQTRTTTWHGVNNTMEMEVFSNALMLFYDKKVPTVQRDVSNDACDFEAEVWRENEAFMQNSYLMDFEFHTFLRELVVETSNPITSKLGLDFMCNVLLHSREKANLTQWLTAFQTIFHQVPESVASFLSKLPREWLKTYFFECPDPMARQSFVTLITHAVSASSISIEVLDQFGQDVLNLLLDPVQPYDDFFLIIRNCAQQNETLRSYFASQDAIGQLIYTFLGERAPPILKEAYMDSIATSTAADYQFLLQAIGAIIKLPRHMPVPVLSSNSTSQCPELSEQATSALYTVYHEHCNPATKRMGATELRQYFRACGVTLADAPATGKKIGYMLSQFGGVDKMLDWKGFRQFYADTAAKGSTKALVDDLMALGFGEDLQRTDHAINDTVIPAREFLRDIPSMSRQGLQDIAFFEMALEEDAEYMADLLVRLCCDEYTVTQLALQCLLRCIIQSETGWKGQPTVTACVAAVSKILAFPGENQDELLDMALQGKSFGILTQAKERADFSRRYPHNYQAIQVTYRLMTILLELYRIEAVESYLSANHKEWEWMYTWLHTASLEPALGGRSSTGYRDPEKLKVLKLLAKIHEFEMVEELTSYLVEGAGTSQVNGLYQVNGEFDGCNTYVCRNGDQTYTLFRCKMPSGTRRWYISITPERGNPGTATDIDFYYIPVQPNVMTPPLANWKIWTKNPNAGNPPPRLSVVTSKEEYGNSDDDDDEGDADDEAEGHNDVRANSDRFEALELDNNQDDDDEEPDDSRDFI